MENKLDPGLAGEEYPQEYRGLSNQGATCYMNSLLQTLYMTPEFRRATYKLTFDYEKHEDSVDSIPFQLQRLFAKLQTSIAQSVETTGLTRSFQWETSEAFQQNDVQEFCRVLFGAIEESVEGTEQSGFIAELFEGKMSDYIKCSSCLHESQREGVFLDLSLTVKNEFENLHNDTVEKALENYLVSVTLSGENQYFCENCEGKRDAEKGTKFVRLPYILVLHLNRFTLDFNTFERVKLSDKVSFPMGLNMNSDSGEFAYQLYSIMIHSGSAFGGHYYTYIQSFENECWYNFNDSSVTKISESDIPKIFGGTEGSSTGYLLFYRKIDSSNLFLVDESEIPEYIRSEMAKDKEEELKLEAERLERLKWLNIKVFNGKEFMWVEIHRDKLLSELIEVTIIYFGISYDSDNVRIRKYSEFYNIAQDIYNNNETLDSQGINSKSTLALETKESYEEFPKYDSGELILLVYIYDETTSSAEDAYDRMIKSGKTLRAQNTDTIAELTASVSSLTGIDPEDLAILCKLEDFPDSSLQQITQIQYANYSLSQFKMSGISQLFVEKQTKRAESKWQGLLRLETYKLVVKFNDPDAIPNRINICTYNFSVRISHQATIELLKTKISEKICLDPSEFIMRKHFQTGLELKDPQATIQQSGLAGFKQVHIERGCSAAEKLLQVNFYQVFTPASTDHPDRTRYLFEKLFTLHISLSKTIFEVKEQFCAELAKSMVEIDPSKVRLRERYQENLGMRLNNSALLRDHHLFSEKNIGIQFLDEPETEVGSEDVIIIARRWFPITSELTVPQEMIVNSLGTVGEMGFSLSSLFTIPFENVEIFFTKMVESFTRERLFAEEFVRCLGNNTILREDPWYLDHNESILIVKDASEPVVVDQDMVKSVEKTSGLDRDEGAEGRHRSCPEQGIKITVKKKRVNH